MAPAVLALPRAAGETLCELRVGERLEGEALLGATELARPLHDDAAALLERLDAEERPASAVEVDAVVTALRVARMVLDLESFARQVR